MMKSEKKEDVVGKGVVPKLILGFSCLAIGLLFAGSASAATVTVNCASLNGNDIVISPTTSAGPGRLVIADGADVLVPCLLDGKSVTIRAHTITVDHTTVGNTGAIHTVNKEGIRLLAGLDSTGNKCGDPLINNAPPDPTAQIHILSAALADDNSNGGIKFTSCGDIEITAGSSLISNGANVQGECLYPSAASTTPWCTLTATGTDFFGNHVELYSKGNLTLTSDAVTTIGPRDQQTFVSYFASVLAGTNCPTDGNGDGLTCPPGTIPIELACLFCQECNNHNSFFGGIESNFFAFGEQEVDFDNACISIAENITITAVGRLPVSPFTLTGGGVGPGGAYYIDLQDAEIRDDFGKTGYISITAVPPLKKSKPVQTGDVPNFPGGYPCSSTWSGTGAIWYDNAVLVDDGANGGGVDPQAVAFMNGCRKADPSVLGCGVVTHNPGCNPAPVPNRGFVADPPDRLLHNIQGTARCDS